MECETFRKVCWSCSLCYCNNAWNLLAGALVMFFVLGKARDIMQHGTFCTAGRSCRMYHFCHNKKFVVTNTPLSQQKFCHDKHAFVMTKDAFCRDKTFVVSKSILGGVPANDTSGRCTDPTFSLPPRSQKATSPLL